MRFRFFLSAPRGDIELGPEDLAQPFLVSPTEKHPFLCLKDYFGALQKFILADEGKLLQAALTGRNLHLAGISEVLVCSEKHGAFYHIASIVPVGVEKKVKFAVITALADSAKSSLKNEFLLMQQLAAQNPDFLPELYCRESIIWPTDSGTAEFYMVLGEWLTGYHEWHLSYNPAEKKHQIQLWDYEAGYRFLSEAECYEVLRQAAYILTCYYDQASFRQIYPWHHGAGDFVVKAEAGVIRVKLITVRQYEPLVYFEKAEEHDRLIGLIQFLLNLSLRIRLDRVDGTGAPGWFHDFAVNAAVEGFFSGLDAVSGSSGMSYGPLNELLGILQSFSAQEIFDMYASLLEIYADEDQDDYGLILEKLADHATELQNALQQFSLQNS